jgi:hypothetical protein
LPKIITRPALRFIPSKALGRSIGPRPLTRATAVTRSGNAHAHASA